MGVSTPLSELASLTEISLRLRMPHTINYICAVVLKIWASILFHPKFQVAMFCFDFSCWIEKGLDKFYFLGNSSGMHSEQIVLSRLGNVPNQSAPFQLVKKLINSL